MRRAVHRMLREMVERLDVRVLVVEEHALDAAAALDEYVRGGAGDAAILCGRPGRRRGARWRYLPWWSGCASATRVVPTTWSASAAPPATRSGSPGTSSTGITEPGVASSTGEAPRTRPCSRLLTSPIRNGSRADRTTAPSCERSWATATCPSDASVITPSPATHSRRHPATSRSPCSPRWTRRRGTSTFGDRP